MSNFGEREVTEAVQFYVAWSTGYNPNPNRRNQPSEDDRGETIVNQLVPVPQHPHLWVADFTLRRASSFFPSDLVHLAVISEDKTEYPLTPEGELHNKVFLLTEDYAPGTNLHYGIAKVEVKSLSNDQLRLDPSKGYYRRPFHDSLVVDTYKGENFYDHYTGKRDQEYISIDRNNGGLHITVALASIYGTYYGTRHNEIPR